MEALQRDSDFAQVHRICAQHRIAVRDLRSITGSFDKRIFSINDAYLLRVSETSMEGEQAKFGRVAALRFVPKIMHVGALEREAGPLYYTLLTLLPGEDFVTAYAGTTAAQQEQLGKDVAAFLDELHAFAGTHYDIGLYIPAIPSFAGTWRAGHQAYWEILRRGAQALPLQPDSVGVFERAFRFLEASAAALDVQAGPRVLHNDFHPRNILLDRGRFSGVIDWECSQFGEADFELCHVVHWCAYPPRPDIDYRPFLGALFQASPHCARVPDLAERLAIYQVEHEIQQIIWHGSEAEAWRVPRIERWIDGGVDDLLGQVHSRPFSSAS
jgi:aminoglycoside phosphotransferase (APT) family kinase protein